jgi:predicted nucleic acid-binding protein
MIADTSFIIDLLRHDEKALKKAENLEQKNRAYSLTSPTIYELWISVARSNSQEKEEILDILSSQPLNSLDKKSAQKAGQIQEKLIDKGERIGHLDALIAGIALENGEKLLTRNQDEFQRIKEISIEEY